MTSGHENHCLNEDWIDLCEEAVTSPAGRGLLTTTTTTTATTTTMSVQGLRVKHFGSRIATLHIISTNP